MEKFSVFIVRLSEIVTNGDGDGVNLTDVQTHKILFHFFLLLALLDDRALFYEIGFFLPLFSILFVINSFGIFAFPRDARM